MKSLLPLENGRRVIIHSLGPSCPGEFKGTICGLLFDDGIYRMYAVRLDDKAELHWDYDVISVPDSCLRTCDLLDEHRYVL